MERRILVLNDQDKVAELIADQVDNAVSLTHPVGCGQVGEDLELTERTLIAMGNHPNLAAVLVVGHAGKRYSHRGAIISTGNFDGGVSSVVEKALGNILKSGSMPIQGVVGYAEKPDHLGGVYLMDSPSHDGEVVTSFVGGGAHVIVFTSGRGTPAGFPFAPVIKVVGNSFTYEKMKENIDIDAGTIIHNGSTVDDVGREIFDLVLNAASGKKVKAEILGHDELFCVTRAIVPESLVGSRIEEHRA
jgi:altronate dehydratase